MLNTNEKTYICIAVCPELDEENIKHCKATLEQRNKREEQFADYCPCGNIAKWEEVK